MIVCRDGSNADGNIASFRSIVNAIIFLAPISAFDEKLAEDPTVNRLVRAQTCILSAADIYSRMAVLYSFHPFGNRCYLSITRSRARFSYIDVTLHQHSGTGNIN
jgi:hypothetical protein